MVFDFDFRRGFGFSLRFSSFQGCSNIRFGVVHCDFPGFLEVSQLHSPNQKNITPAETPNS